jgi:glycosyltransferase involved in cell wall biosynthesis
LQQKHKTIIVHTHSTKAGLIGRWAAFFARIKTRIHTVHGFGFHEYQNKIGWIINFLLEYLTSLITTHYVCVSENDRKTGIRLFPNFKPKSSIIRAAVDWNRFYIPAKKSILPPQHSKKFYGATATKNFIFGTISCLKPQKNIFDLLRAFKLLVEKETSPERGLQLQIIGDGLLKNKMLEWINKNNLSSKIKHLGWQKDVGKIIKNWDAFVMSSLWEGLPCSIIEARLSRLPVISYRISGIPEIIKHGKNGLLADPNNWKQLSENMNLLAQNPQKHQELVNYKDNLTEFKNEYMIAEHISLYKSLKNIV